MQRKEFVLKSGNIIEKFVFSIFGKRKQDSNLHLEKNSELASLIY